MTDGGAVGPRYDASNPAALLGKKVLMAVRHKNRDGSLARREQLHGTIISADPLHGIEVQLAGSREGEIFLLPPVIQCCEEARPGRYTLKGTGEVVENPDLIVTLSVTDLRESEPGGLA